MKHKKIEFTFSVDVNDGEITTYEADNLEEARRMFAEDHPEDVDKITCITSPANGYEWLK